MILLLLFFLCCNEVLLCADGDSGQMTLEKFIAKYDRKPHKPTGPKPRLKPKEESKASVLNPAALVGAAGTGRVADEEDFLGPGLYPEAAPISARAAAEGEDYKCDEISPPAVPAVAEDFFSDSDEEEPTGRKSASFSSGTTAPCPSDLQEDSLERVFIPFSLIHRIDQENIADSLLHAGVRFSYKNRYDYATWDIEDIDLILFTGFDAVLMPGVRINTNNLGGLRKFAHYKSWKISQQSRLAQLSKHPKKFLCEACEEYGITGKKRKDLFERAGVIDEPVSDRS